MNKSDYMIFGPKRTCQSDNQIVLNGISIEKVKMFKFLYVLMDEHFTWNQHVLFVKNKIAKGLEILLFYSEVWVSTSKKKLLPLLAL